MDAYARLNAAMGVVPMRVTSPGKRRVKTGGNMKFNLSNEQIDQVVARSCAPMSDEGLRLFSFLHDICGEEEESDPEMEAELGFSTVDTVDKCIAWLSW